MRLYTIAAAAGLVLGGASLARADEIHVPGDFRTLQQAVDAAGVGDTIVVDRGTQRGTIAVTTPGLTIVGGAKARIRQAGKAHGARYALRISASNVTVRGLRFYRGGIEATAPDTVVEGCTFRGVRNTVGGVSVIDTVGTRVTVKDNLVARNCAGGMAIRVAGQDATVTGNTVEAARIAGGAVVVGDDALVAGNEVDLRPGLAGVLVNGDGARITANRVAGGDLCILGDGAEVQGNRVEGGPLGRASVRLEGDGGTLLGNEVVGGEDTAFLVRGDGNSVVGNSATDVGSVVDGHSVGHGFVIRGAANLVGDDLVDGCLGEGFRVVGNGELVLVTDPGTGASGFQIVTGPGNQLQGCTGSLAGTCGLGNWTYGTGVTDSSFLDNGVDVVDGQGFDSFDGNTWDTGGPGYGGSGRVDTTEAGDLWNVATTFLGGD